MFVGFATLKKCFGGVILTGKNTHIVGNLQMAYDPLFMPYKDKPSTNPRYDALYNILGRVNDKLQTNDDCDSGKRGLERAESSDEESSNADSFNPLCVDKASMKSILRTVPSIVRRVNCTDANADEQLLNELRKGNGEDKEVRDGSDLEASSSSEALAQAGRRTRSKSKGRGKAEQPLSLAKRVIGSKNTGARLVVKRRQVATVQ
jgi:hypothetical protein